MTRPGILRILRIGWSAGCVIACLLLIVLWVRSYFHADDLNVPLTGPIVVSAASMRGKTLWSVSRIQATDNPALGKLRRVVGIIGDDQNELRNFDQRARAWHVVPSGGIASTVFILPHWFPCALLAALAVAPWLPWRFSLRALLIVTTLVAVVLGVIVWGTS